MTSILQDLLRDDLTENDDRIVIQKVFDFSFSDTRNYSTAPSVERSKTSGNAKSLLEFFDLVRQAIRDMETRAGTPEKDKVLLTEEEPNVKAVSETITISTVKRQPGAFDGGAPFEGSVKNLRPLIREEGIDPAFPGYRYVIAGYWHDNLIRFTCWARTNKAANKRAEWFESLMEEYSWWFALQGVNRTIFWQQGPDIVTVVDGNKWYGRPLDYFVRTEKLKQYNEKTLEDILVRLAVKSEIT